MLFLLFLSKAAAQSFTQSFTWNRTCGISLAGDEVVLGVIYLDCDGVAQYALRVADGTTSEIPFHGLYWALFWVPQAGSYYWNSIDDGGMYQGYVYKWQSGSLVRIGTGIGFECSSIVYDSGRQLLYLVMGKSGWWSFSNDVYTYNAATNTWTILSSSSSSKPSPRWQAAVSWEPQASNLYVACGGTDFYGMYNDVWSFNVDMKTWTQLPASGDLPPQGYAVGVINIDTISREMFVVSGGSLRAYSILTGVWRLLRTSFPSGGMVFLPSSHQLFVAVQASGQTSLWVYTPDTYNSWARSQSPLPAPSTSPTPSPSPSQPPPSSPQTASVIGDPVTYFGNVRAEFSLPYNRLTLLIDMVDMKIYAQPFRGKQGEQWIGKVLVRNAVDENVVDVTVRPVISFIVPPEPTKMFRTILARALWAEPYFLEPRSGYQLRYGLHLFADQLSYHIDLKGAPPREFVIVSGKFGIAVIISSSAKEFYGNSASAYEHTHLDVDFFELSNVSQMNGLLPDLWGIPK
jgi:hypothetical protein